MKEIKAVFAPTRLPALYEALRALDSFPGMTVTRAEGYVGSAVPQVHSIREELTDHLPRVRVEIVAPDEAAEALFERVVQSVSSGRPGDSLVWMTEVGRAAFVHKTG